MIDPAVAAQALVGVSGTVFHAPTQQKVCVLGGEVVGGYAAELPPEAQAEAERMIWEAALRGPGVRRPLDESGEQEEGEERVPVLAGDRTIPGLAELQRLEGEILRQMASGRLRPSPPVSRWVLGSVY